MHWYLQKDHKKIFPRVLWDHALIICLQWNFSSSLYSGPDLTGISTWNNNHEGLFPQIKMIKFGSSCENHWGSGLKTGSLWQNSCHFKQKERQNKVYLLYLVNLIVLLIEHNKTNLGWVFFFLVWGGGGGGGTSQGPHSWMKYCICSYCHN